ncbi:hypothetical protein ALC60_14632 [Trachymyrmex zeteki]|uniref:Uncharacterized protein n=1 Tax=Mycetomoellerius zeteki TaxID=64791 RepID=A0A151WEE7_9HYME|nr:hypothetical protein ALC60_14632 [Trachymyrmex zeteki]
MVKRISRDAVALIVLPDKFEKYLKFNHELNENAFAPQSKDYLRLVSGNTRALFPPESIFPVSVKDYLLIGDIFCCLKSEMKFIYRALLTQLLKLYYSCEAKSDNSYCTSEAKYFIYSERERKVKLRHARLLALWRNFSLNLVSDGDEGRTSDRTFPFYLSVPQGQSISLEYYIINILEHRKKFLQKLRRGVLFYKSRGLKLVMVHVSKNILLTQQVIDEVYITMDVGIVAIDYCVTYSKYSSGNYLWLSKKRNWICQKRQQGVVQHRTLTISFDEANPFRFSYIHTFLVPFHFQEFPLNYVKRSYRAFHSDAPVTTRFFSCFLLQTLPFGGRNKREGGINHREVRARGMHYAHYLERISTIEPESIGRNNAIETYQEGGALQIAQIQAVRQVPTDNLAYPRVFGTIGRRE